MLHNLPYNLRWLRRSRDLSQAKLAALSGFRQQYISALEHGLRPASEEHVQRLAEALGVSLAAILRRPGVVRHIATIHPVVLHAKSSPSCDTPSGLNCSSSDLLTEGEDRDA